MPKRQLINIILETLNQGIICEEDTPDREQITHKGKLYTTAWSSANEDPDSVEWVTDDGTGQRYPVLKRSLHPEAELPEWKKVYTKEDPMFRSDADKLQRLGFTKPSDEEITAKNLEKRHSGGGLWGAGFDKPFTNSSLSDMYYAITGKKEPGYEDYPSYWQDWATGALGALGGDGKPAPKPNWKKVFVRQSE